MNHNDEVIEKAGKDRFEILRGPRRIDCFEYIAPAHTHATALPF